MFRELLCPGGFSPSELFSPRSFFFLGGVRSSANFSSRSGSSRRPSLRGAYFSYERTPRASSGSREGGSELIRRLLGSTVQASIRKGAQCENFD
jgi:hypothetical protein